MASFNFYLKDNKSETKSPVYLLFDDGVNRAKFYFQQSIRPKDWNLEKGEARKSLQGYLDFNGKLKKFRDKCEELHNGLIKDGNFSVDKLRDRLRTYIDELYNRRLSNLSGESKNFEGITDFTIHYIKSVENSKSKNTLKHNRQTLRLLREFESSKRRKLTFERINLDFYNDFIDFLKQKGYSKNSIGKHIRNLKLFLNEARKANIFFKILSLCQKNYQVSGCDACLLACAKKVFMYGCFCRVKSVYPFQLLYFRLCL